MQVGLVGLGRMGAAMAERLLGRRHEVVVYDRSPAKIRQLQGRGARRTPWGNSPSNCAARASCG